MGKIADLIARMHADGMPMPAIIAAVKDAEDGGRRNLAGNFAAWWAAFPNKVGKGAAEKAYEKAIRLAAPEVLLDGVHRYAAKRDDRPWCNPATWLNQRRWEDEAPQPIATRPKSMAGSFFEAAALSMEYDDAQVGTVDAPRSPVRRLPER